MDFFKYPITEAVQIESTELRGSPKHEQKNIFSAELCGIWLSDLPFNQHIETNTLRVHSSFASRLPSCADRSHFCDSTKTVLPQKSSKKNSTLFNIGARLTSPDSFIKSESLDLADDAAMRLSFAYGHELEACRITGFITCLNGCLVFFSRDSDLKIPVYLGGLCNFDLSSSPQNYPTGCGYSFNCDPLSSETIFDLSYWTMKNDTNFSCQSLFSNHTGCFSSSKKLWSGIIGPSYLRKRNFKQLWTSLLSKKLSHNIQTLDGSDQPVASQTETLRLEWPFTTLRQFAFQGYLFKIETGRRAPHGEGQYLFRIPDITGFRQNIEAHIDHQKRSRALKTHATACGSSNGRSSPPLMPPPPPPPSMSNCRAYANIPLLIQPKHNQSWTDLLKSTDKHVGHKGADDLDEGCNDWLVELSPPAPPLSAPPVIEGVESHSSIINFQFPLPRVGTYENVRSFLPSRETRPLDSRLTPMTQVPFETNAVHVGASTLNYAMLDFQAPACFAVTATRSLRARTARPQLHSILLSPSSSCERFSRVLSSRSPSRLSRSVEARLNATNGEQGGTEGGIGGNYVDICPLQTLAINELLRSTLSD